MSRNPSILEGGAAKTASNVNRLVTALQAGGVCYWVPEDERMLVTKYAPKNGLYLPAEDGVFAYSKITVNVPGGAPGVDVPTLDENGNQMPSPTDPSYDPTVPTYGPVQVDPTTPSTEIPAIPGGPGSSISGINPTTGNGAVAKVGENGEITMKDVPTKLRIVRSPDKTKYTEGDKMVYDGIVCELLLEDGSLFTDERHEDGLAKFGELSFPMQVATPTGTIYYGTMTKGDVEVHGRHCTGPVIGIPLNNGDEYARSPGSTFKIRDAGGPVFMTAYLNTENNQITLVQASHYGFWNAYVATVGDERFYYCGLNMGNFSGQILVPYSATQNDHNLYLAQTLAYIMLYGEDGNAKVETLTQVPVQWHSPYDGRTLEDTFEAEITFKDDQPTPDDGEWSGSGGGDFGGGGGAGTGF